MSFCTIKYCEYDNFIAQTFTWSAKDKVDANINENKEILVNPLCYAQLLIEYIYEFAKFDAQVNFDLCDDAGHMYKLRTLKPNDYAINLLKYEEVYYIILFECNDVGKYTKLEPLLCKSSKLYTDVNAKLRKHFSVSKTTMIRRSRISEKSSSKSFGSQVGGIRGSTVKRF